MHQWYRFCLFLQFFCWNLQLFRQCGFCGISFQQCIIYVYVLKLLFLLHTDEPTVQVPKSSYIVNYMLPVTLECTVTSVLNQTSVQWFRLNNNQYEAIILSSNKYDGSTVSLPSLSLRHASYADMGKYICTATNTNGTGLSTPTHLNVNAGNNLTISRQFQKHYFKKQILFTLCICHSQVKRTNQTKRYALLRKSTNSPITRENPIYGFSFSEGVELSLG